MRSAGRTQQRGQHLDGGSFARAVGAEKGEYLSLRDVERDVLDGGEVAEGLDQVPDGDHPDGFLLDGSRSQLNTERFSLVCQDLQYGVQRTGPAISSLAWLRCNLSTPPVMKQRGPLAGMLERRFADSLFLTRCTAMRNFLVYVGVLNRYAVLCRTTFVTRLQARSTKAGNTPGTYNLTEPLDGSDYDPA